MPRPPAQPTGIGSTFASPGDSPGFLLWQVTNAWQREMRDALLPLDLTHVQFVLLATATWCATRNEPPSQRALAELVRADQMMTSQVVRALARKGLVVRTRDLSDARTIRISPSAAGRALVARAVAVVEAADAQFFDALGSKIADFSRALSRLAATTA